MKNYRLSCEGKKVAVNANSEIEIEIESKSQQTQQAETFFA